MEQRPSRITTAWHPTAIVLGLTMASLLVLLASLLASFRRGFADDFATAWLVNGPRVLFAAAVGAALALSGGLRLAGGRERPLREVELLAVSVGGAGGGWILIRNAQEAAPVAWFALGAVIAATALVGLLRWLDRPRRWTNLAHAALLAGLGTVAAVAGTYARERQDLVAAIVSWLLGDLGGTTFASAGAMMTVSVSLAAVAWRQLDSKTSAEGLSLVAFGLATGAAGPLAFVGTLAPRTVHWLAAGVTPRTLLLADMLAGAATVAAVDAVPRLLLGGYDFPWNVPATMLAIPIFLGWNRARLRRICTPAPLAFEVLEILIIVGLTIGAAALAMTLTRIIHIAT